MPPTLDSHTIVQQFTVQTPCFWSGYIDPNAWTVFPHTVVVSFVILFVDTRERHVLHVVPGAVVLPHDPVEKYCGAPLTSPSSHHQTYPRPVYLISGCRTFYFRPCFDWSWS